MASKSTGTIRYFLAHTDSSLLLKDTTMQTIITRTGHPPLLFNGELIASVTGDVPSKRERPGTRKRFHTIAVYRTDGGKYVVNIGYQSTWETESNNYQAFIVEKPGDVYSVLKSYNPLSPVIGFPPGESYVEKQARLMKEIKMRWENMVSDILASSPEFAEEVK